MTARQSGEQRESLPMRSSCWVVGILGAKNMSAISTIEELTSAQAKKPGRRTDKLRPAASASSIAVHCPVSEMAPAVARQSSQLPAFAPLLDELELAGWSSHRRMLSGNFHDWLMLDGRTIMSVAGHAVGPPSMDTTEAALVVQAAWATIRAHAARVRDAGELLSLAAASLWRPAIEGVQAAVAVALLDTVEGHASIAMAGDCLVWRVRATAFEQLTVRQPLLGGVSDFSYASQFIQLAVRERLLLVADNPLERPATLALNIAGSFSRLDAESHRRMVAADALAIVRNHYLQNATENLSPSASIVTVRRR